MAIGNTRARHIKDSAVTAAKIADSAITTAKINNLAVTTGKLAAGAVDGSKLANGAVQTANLAQNVMQSATVTLTNTEFLALRATPKQLVPAPGAGKVNEFISATLSCLASGGAYTETTDNLVVRYTNGSGNICSGVIETTGVIDQTTQQYSFAGPIACLPVANAPFVLHNTGDGEFGGEFGGGNAANTIKVLVNYRVITLP